MPSSQHEILVELFRACGELAPIVLAACAHVELPHDHAEMSSIDLSQAVPTEYRADVVVELRASDQSLVAAVIVEIQLRADGDKRFSWPAYVASLHARLRCRVFLLVVSPDRGVAAWAQHPIEIGHPGFVLQPIAVAFTDLPRTIDPEQARKLPELAVLTAMAHPEIGTAKTAMQAIRALTEEEHKLYMDLILERLPDALRQQLEVEMLRDNYESKLERRLYARGKNDGREQGLQDAVIHVLRRKLPGLVATDEAKVRAVREPEALLALNTDLALAIHPADVRALVDRLPDPPANEPASPERL